MSDNRRNRKSSYVGTLGSIVLQEQWTPAGTTTSSSEPPVIAQV
jgi:hypothetical protein